MCCIYSEHGAGVAQSFQCLGYELGVWEIVRSPADARGVSLLQSVQTGAAAQPGSFQWVRACGGGGVSFTGNNAIGVWSWLLVLIQQRGWESVYRDCFALPYMGCFVIRTACCMPGITERQKTNRSDKNVLPYNVKSRLRLSRGSVLAFSTQVRGFKPGRSRRILRAKKSSARLPSEGK